MPQTLQRRYDAAVRSTCPDFTVDSVGHHGEAASLIEQADILIAYAPHVPPPLLSKARRLQWIQSLGAGVEGFDVLCASRPQLLLTNMRGVAAEPVAEGALLAMLALARDLPRNVRDQQRQAWAPRSVRLLARATVGILGVGTIAEALGPRCQALGMRVLGISSTPRQVPGFDRIEPMDRLRELVRELDYLVVLTPYSSRTDRLIDAHVLAAMKPGSCLVNLARGAIIDEAALLDALDSGPLRAAALDVFTSEPLPVGHPFWTHERILVTPHQGGRSEVRDDWAIEILVDNLRCYMAGDIDGMRNVIHRPALTTRE